MIVYNPYKSIIFYAVLKKYFFTLFNGFFSEISYFYISWPLGALQLISCVRCFKNGLLQSILCVFISVELGLDTRSEK